MLGKDTFICKAKRNGGVTQKTPASESQGHPYPRARDVAIRGSGLVDSCSVGAI